MPARSSEEHWGDADWTRRLPPASDNPTQLCLGQSLKFKAMAHDVRDSYFLQPPDSGSVPDEQLSEQPSTTEWMSAQSNPSVGAVNSDHDLGHNEDAVDQSAGTSRSPESTVVGDTEFGPIMGRKPRTLPGNLSMDPSTLLP